MLLSAWSPLPLLTICSPLEFKLYPRHQSANPHEAERMRSCGFLSLSSHYSPPFPFRGFCGFQSKQENDWRVKALLMYNLINQPFRSTPGIQHWARGFEGQTSPSAFAGGRNQNWPWASFLSFYIDADAFILKGNVHRLEGEGWVSSITGSGHRVASRPRQQNLNNVFEVWMMKCLEINGYESNFPYA